MSLFRKFMVCGALSALGGCGLFASDIPNSALQTDVASEPVIESSGPANGFFDRLMGSPSSTAGANIDTPTAPALTDENDSLSIPVVAERPPRTGFFGLLGGFDTETAPEGIATVAVPSSGRLAYGDIATVCGLSTRNLGREVESKSGYTVFDTDPSTTAARTHFITGFSDGCARQFTAALAIFGDIGTHEVVRYSAADAGLEYTETDDAYEEIKADFCGVRAGQPCGARLERLARRTTFLTVYERFGSNPVWADVLLHDGAVVAMDFKGD